MFRIRKGHRQIFFCDITHNQTGIRETLRSKFIKSLQHLATITIIIQIKQEFTKIYEYLHVMKIQD
jgi:hypothetical protein